MKRIEEARKQVVGAYNLASAYVYYFVVRNPNVILLAIGLVIILQGIAELSHADGFTAAGGGSPAGPDAGSGGGSPVGPIAAGGGSPVGPIAAGGGSPVGPAAAGGTPVNGNAVQACSRAVGYLQGGFGTLVASAAGIGAIVAAALGGFKAAWALFVVSVGTFVLRTYLTLFLTGC